jgi:large subunit ribosomal protein L13
MSTYIPSAKEISPKWYLVDADGEVLGRLASRVARLLHGKDSPRYTPFLDTGEHVIVINAARVRFTGAKLETKLYHHFTGYPGGLRTRSLRDRLQAHPEEVVREAIEGMLPRTKLGKQLARKLRVYRDDRHEHAAQRPEPVRLTRRAAPAGKARG